MNFRTLEENDWEQVSEIYRQGIATKNATFQLEVPSWEDWDKAHLNTCRCVLEKEAKIIGWYALSPVSSRYVYRGVAEVSIYVALDFYGQKIGTLLMESLIKDSENNGIWTLQSSIFPENKASIAIHKKFGFREMGYREKIGKMEGVWRDTILLERRSQVIGIV